LGPRRLRAIYALDRLRFRWACRRFGPGLVVDPSASPNLRFARLRIEPGGRVEIGARVATERQPGNHLWVQAGGSLEIGEDVWLRTEHAENRITVFRGARIRLGALALLNGTMLHAKSAIEIGEDSMLGFGSRVFDSDLHPLDVSTPERILPVRIGARVWIASDVTVLRGVTIGDDVAVGAGSVVTRDLPSRVLAVGSPAKPIRSIDRRPTLPE
jgi:acetyltransferase-like isoleucine patch superfamily enzyme